MFFINGIGGLPVLLIIILCSVILILAVAFFFVKYSKWSELKNNSLRDFLLTRYDDDDWKWLINWFSQQEFETNDIPYHIGRLYFSGHNGPNHRFKFPKWIPNSINAIVNIEKLKEIINQNTKWKNDKYEHYSMKILQIVYPPLKDIILFWGKRRRARDLKRNADS